MKNKDIKEIINFSKDLNVLFVEDNEEVREQISKLLINFFPKLTCAVDGEQALNFYNSFKETKCNHYDLIISDLNLPKLDGINLSKKILKKNPEQIILVISAHTESKKLLSLIEIGIYKFLQKPVDYQSFLDTIISTIEKIKSEKNKNEDILKIQSKNQELDELIKIDKLTNINNRAFIDEYLENRINLFKGRDCMTLAMIDIDNFKLINDSYGHLIGDEILIEFAKFIKLHTKENDIFARWGGEEFILVFNDCRLEQATQKVNKIREKIEKYTFLEDIKLTASFGLSELEEDDNIKSLIQRADSNLYKSKTTGKNKVT